MKVFTAQAKFLITGEYLILHGAQALAIPLSKKNQQLLVKDHFEKESIWQAFDEKNQLWFQARFHPASFESSQTNNEKMAKKLFILLNQIKDLRPDLFESPLLFETRMNFSPDWGFGSSSTFISLLAQWAGMDVFELAKKFSSGSGYDLACANAKGPILFEFDPCNPRVKDVDWSPRFKEHLYFVYLGKKQDSQQAINYFKSRLEQVSPDLLKKMNQLTKSFLMAVDLERFKDLLREHEYFMSELLNIQPIKDKIFPDFNGAMKSLGGWGGDFILVASENDPRNYFLAKGYHLMFKWNDLV